MSDKINTLTNVVVLVVALVLLLSPTGPIGSRYAAWRAHSVETRLVRGLWNRLTADSPSLGPAGAPVQVVEFLDYQCPFCRKGHDQARASGVDREIRMVVRHLPLRLIHSNAELAASISICASRQPDHWQGVHEALFVIADSLHQLDWVTFLSSRVIDVDTAALKECVDNDEASTRLAEDESFAEQLGLRGTPAYVFTDGIHRGVVPVETFRRRAGQN